MSGAAPRSRDKDSARYGRRRRPRHRLHRRQRRLHRRPPRALDRRPGLRRPRLRRAVCRTRRRAARGAHRRLRRILGTAPLLARRRRTRPETGRESGPELGQRRRAARDHPRRHHGQHPRAHADPLVSRARASRGAARPARPHGAEAPRRARPRQLRLFRGRPRPPDLHRQRARPRERHAARDRRDPARDLLRPDRRRVHAHPGPRPKILDPAHGRGRALAHRVRSDDAGENPARPDRGRGVREFLPKTLRRHQAVRAGGRRSHHPRRAGHHRDGGRRRRCRDRDRDAASRTPQHAGQHRPQAADRDLLRVRRQQFQAGRRAGLGRRQIPPRHIHRHRGRRPQRSSILAAESLAPRSR